MKIRQKLLLNILLKSKKENMDKLAKDFKVSIRTIRNDIEEIQEYLNENFSYNCIDVKNKNVILNLEEENIRNLVFNEEEEKDYYNYKLSTEERVVLILIQLVSSEEYITIDYICNKLSVSRGTINSDILLVKDWSKNHNIKLMSTKGKGLRVNESEKRRRFLLLEITREYNDLINVGITDKYYLEPYKKLFKHVNIEEIKEIIIEAEEKFKFTLSDVAFEGLLIHIALSVERNIEDKMVTLEDEIGAISKDNREYKIAKYILEILQKKYNIVMPKEEIYYIALHICGKSSDRIGDTNEECIYFQLMTNSLIEKISKLFNIDFRNDFRLYEDLYKHIGATIFRFENGLTLRNPLKNSLIKEYSEIYEAVKKNSNKVKEYIGQELSDDEIAYIVLHFAAAIERIKSERKSEIPSVLIACSTGIGTANLVLSRLDKYFNFNVKKVIAVHQLKKTLREEKVDFVISTVQIDEDYPSVTVSPLLKDSDIENINNVLLKLGFSINNSQGKKEINMLASKVYELLEKFENTGKENELKDELFKLLKEEKKEKKRKEVLLMLSEVLKREYISLGDDCKDWIEAVRASGNILVKNRVIENDYIESAISNVKESGPYIVLTKGVAIPHASNKYGVYKTAISLVRLKTPVKFNSSENDPVKYVFMLATVDSNSHVLALADLVNLLGDKNFFRCIDQSKDGSEIIEYIKENETKL